MHVCSRANFATRVPLALGGSAHRLRRWLGRLFGSGAGGCDHGGGAVIIALDPGPSETGWVIYQGGRVVHSNVSSNEEVLTRLGYQFAFDSYRPLLAIEMIASYGMPVGREVFETCVWIGRFQQAWHKQNDVRLIYRKDVKLHLCGTAKAKDQNIRQALLDKLGPQGTKKAPGPTHGVKSHAWAALAVAVTVHETFVAPGHRPLATAQRELLGAAV